MNVEEMKPWLDEVENYQQSSWGDGTLPRKYTVGIRPSAYGLGLFANEAIPTGICVTLYPAHVVGTTSGNGTVTMAIIEDSAFDVRPEYMLKTPSGDVICGHPEMTYNKWFIGHMANDAADVACFRKKREYESAVVYGLMSQRANMRVEWYKGIPMMVTTRPVEANEELVWTYGVNYWFNVKGMKDANQRITAYLLRQPKAKRQEMMALLTSIPDIFQAAALRETSC